LEAKNSRITFGGRRKRADRQSTKEGGEPEEKRIKGKRETRRRITSEERGLWKTQG